MKQKMTLPLLAMVLVVSMVLVVTQYMSSKAIAEVTIRDKLAVSSELASLVYSNALWNYNYEGMEDIANAMLKDPEIGSVAVRTYSGKEVFRKSAEGKEYGPEDMSVIESIVSYQGEPIGVVSIGVTKYLRQRGLWTDLLRSSFYIILMLGILAIAIDRVARSVTKPIEELERSTEELAQGNLQKRIYLDSGDETGRLAEKFNKMADSLSEMIEERIAAQEALAVSEEKYGKAFRNLSEIVGLTRIENQSYLEVNDVFFKTLGYSPEEVIGHASSEFSLWENSQDRELFFQMLQENGSVKNFESRWRTKSGDVRIGLQSADIVTIADERYEIFIWSDITERKQAEESLRLAHDQLELKVEERTSELMALNEELMAMNDELVSTLDRLKRTQQQLLQSEKMAALGSLVAGISHEISTPIGISVTGVSYIEKELTNVRRKLEAGALKKTEFQDFISETTTFIQTTAKNLERADLLIRSFKQISVDQTSEEIRRFNVGKYLDELLLSLNPLIKNTKFKIAVACPDNMDIVGYPGSLAQVLTNLITNSLKHGFAGTDTGNITIAIDQYGALYTLTYRDDGLGMEPEVLEHIYDPFFTTKRGSEGGTGLGLHLVYNIVTQKLGGEIKCFSEPGRGVSFVITFPDIYSE